MTKTTKLLTLLALTTLVMGAIATPALARDHQDRAPEDAERDAHRHDKQHDHKEAAKQCRDDSNETSDRPDDCKRAMKAMAKAHIAKRCMSAANESDELPPACKRLAKSTGALARCRAAAAHNGTADSNASKLPSSCERLIEVHSGEHKARRAAHAIVKAIDALEHRVARLEMKEMKLMDKLEDGNVTEENATKIEQHLERIQDAQNNTMERIMHLEARLDAIKERWDSARDHVLAQKEKREKDHSDDLDDEDVEEEHEEDSEEEESAGASEESDSAEGNATADPAP